MLVTFITTILLLIFTVLNVKLSKDIISPVSVISFVYCIDFISFIVFAIITNSNYWMPYTSIFFAIGVFVFSIGYYLSLFIINKLVKKRDYVIVDKKNNLSVLCKIIFILEFVITVFFFIHFIFSQWFYIDGSVLRLLNANKIIGYSGHQSFYYLRTLVLVTFYIIVYFMFYNKYNRNEFVYYFLIIIASLLHLIMNGSRTHLFKILIPLFFIYIMRRRKEKNNIYKISLVGIIIIVVMTAGLTAIMRQPLSINFLRCYLNSGIVAFSEWALNPGAKLNGAYTFRILYVILSKLKLYNGPVQWLEMGYLNVPNIDWGYGLGNVYTFYHGYAKDFGLLYALFIQFIVALFHGTVYANAKIKKSSFWIVLLEISYFPLVMQFFTDNYFIMFSYWVQVIIIVLIFLKTNLFFINK